MDYQRQLWLERGLVRLAGIGGLVLGYLLLGPVLVMDEPLAPLTFLQDGLARLGMFVGLVLAISLVLGLVMLPARPGAALMATLLAAGGMSLRSCPLQSLLWYQGQNIPAVYAGLMGEVLLMWVLAVAAWAIIVGTRRLAAQVRPGWVWSGQMPGIATEGGGNTVAAALARTVSAGPSAKRPSRAAAVAGVGFILVAAVVAMAVLVVVLQSNQRKQVAFALVLAFGAAAAAGHRTFGLRREWVALLPPLVVALVLYALGMVAQYPPTSLAWTAAPMHARPLPVDWLTFGAGGSLLGLWISQRLMQEQALASG